MRIEIKNGRTIDPVAGPAEKTIYVENGVLAEKLSATADRVIDATGLYVLPGLIDAHVHLRDPGYEYKEDIVSGTRSAAKGGFTTVACMPNTLPVCDSAAIVRYIKEKAHREGSARVLPIGAATRGEKGRELAEIGLMAEAGIVAVSDDGQPISNTDMMRKAMLYAAQYNLKVISHCEDLSLAAGGQMNEGYWSTILGLPGIPAVAESAMVARECLLSEYLNLPVHIAHVSTRMSVELVRQAKSRGAQVTCETCPHYFTLTEEMCRGFNTQAKMNPPLRTEDDRRAIIDGLRDGTIDIIATDHAPHHEDEKNLEFALASNGIVGLESALALGYSELVKSGIMHMKAWLRTMTVNPARMLGQQLGTLQNGLPADIILVDFSAPFIFDKQKMASKARNTPYDGREMYGRVCCTMLEGRIVYEEFC